MSFLKSSVKIEPLIHKWYAWPHLLAPTTVGNYIQRHHKNIMESYIESPELHEAAILTPSMIGGPFMDFAGINKVEEVKNLLQNTQSEFRSLIEMAEDAWRFILELQDTCIGSSLDVMYDKIPKSLKGLVELTYDLYQIPHLRFIESLVYNKFYNTKHQSIIISETVDDYRPFSLSTPRIEVQSGVHCEIPFESEIIDDLVRSSCNPVDPHDLLSGLGIDMSMKDSFLSLFQKDKDLSAINQKYSQDAIRVRYFGHACVLVETKNCSIMVDPVISYAYQSKLERFTFDDLPPNIDYVLLTHNHQDHVMIETLLYLRHKIGCIVIPPNNSYSLFDPSLKLILQKLGFKNIIILDELEHFDVTDGKITAVPFFGEHGDLNIRSKTAYYLEIKDKTFLFAADSNNLDPELYHNVFLMLKSVDVLFIGMECKGAPISWLYGPLLLKPLKHQDDQKRRLDGSDSKRAFKLVEASKCKEAYVYAMGQEPWLNYIMAVHYEPTSHPIVESNKFISECNGKGIKSMRLYCKHEWYYD